MLLALWSVARPGSLPSILGSAVRAWKHQEHVYVNGQGSVPTKSERRAGHGPGGSPPAGPPVQGTLPSRCRRSGGGTCGGRTVAASRSGGA